MLSEDNNKDKRQILKVVYLQKKTVGYIFLLCTGKVENVELSDRQRTSLRAENHLHSAENKTSLVLSRLRLCSRM